MFQPRAAPVWASVVRLGLQICEMRGSNRAWLGVASLGVELCMERAGPEVRGEELEVGLAPPQMPIREFQLLLALLVSVLHRPAPCNNN